MNSPEKTKSGGRADSQRSDSQRSDNSGRNDALYVELIDGLENLVKVYRSLLDTVRKEKEILSESRLDDLTENNKAKDAMLVRIRSLENHRLKSARDLAQVLGVDQDQPRLLEIAAKADERFQDRLRNLHSVLELLVRRVSEVNKQNEELVRSALTTITGAMDAIRAELKPKPVYARQGQLAEQKTDAGHLVRREV